MAKTPYNTQYGVSGSKYEPKGGAPSNPAPINSHNDFNFGATGGEPDNALPGNVHCGVSILRDAYQIIDLLLTTSTRTTKRTVSGLIPSATYTDQHVLLQLAIGEVAITGGRRISEGVWSDRDVSGRLLPQLKPTLFNDLYTIGDSLTADGRYQSAAAAVNSDMVMTNVGIGGNTLVQMAARFQVDVLDAGATSAFIMGGINDVNGAISSPVSAMKTNVASMVDLADTAGIPCVVSNITPFGDFAGWSAEKQGWLDEFNAWLPGFIQSSQAYFFDGSTVMVDPGTDDILPEWDNDGLHYNAIGYEVYGQLLAKKFSDLSTAVTLTIGDTLVNRCAVVKANPTDLTGITLVDDAGGLATLGLSVEQKMIELAGLDEVCTSFTMVDLDNTLGLSTAKITLAGNIGSTLPSSIDIHAFVTPQTGFVSIGTNAAAGLQNFQNLSSIQHIKTEGFTPTGNGNIVQIGALPGARVRFILPNFVVSPLSPVSPIIGADTAAIATREADINTVPTPEFFSGTWAFEVEFNPHETGQTGSIYASYTDADNYVEILTTATTVVLRKRVGGANYDTTPFNYTHGAGTLARMQCYGGATGTGVRVADSSADITAETFAVNADTTDTVWGAEINWGHLNGTLSFVGEFLISPSGYDSVDSAGWL